MKIVYLGPSPAVNIGLYGTHQRGEIRDYPAAIGSDLLCSPKQRFEEYTEMEEALPPAEPVLGPLSGSLGPLSGSLGPLSGSKADVNKPVKKGKR